jgi:AraC family transcriptional regulator
MAEFSFMEPRREILTEKKLIGIRMRMSLSDNKTGQLWRIFMPRRREITNNLTHELFSMQVYDPTYDFNNFNPDATFEKWAAVEVADFNSIPGDMEPFILKGGLYAVFLHKGAAATGPVTFRYIFGSWIPNSPYMIDNRPHFEILGEKYKNDDPDSEEEIWIPVKQAPDN